MSTRTCVAPRLRPLRRAIAVAVLALASACGDSGAPAGSEPGVMEAATNLVVHNDAPGVVRKGSFDRFEGYLAESATSLRAPVGSGSSSARFDLGGVAPGFYEVFAWWPQTGGEGSAARVTVEHAEGETVSSMDQSVLGGQWNSLGVYELGQGTSAVTFAQIAGAPMLVDAVRAFRVGDQRPELSVSSDRLLIGELDQEYRERLEAKGGRVPYTFRLVEEGSLPPGLVLDSSSGVISGRPAYTGGYTFQLEVSDAAGQRAVSEVSIEVIASSDAGPEAAAERDAKAASEFSDPQSRTSLATKSTGSLLSIIAAMPEGSWKKVNQNSFSDAWAPAALRPLFGSGNPAPSKIIAAWSSFAWDSKRGNLLLYGGGHANYRGNEVYLWRGSTQRWERASLPSESKQNRLGHWNAVDGADHSPASAHTYDNTIYLPIMDRMLVLGGAADSNGGHFFTESASGTAIRTGPYLFDPNRTHPDRVGGTTGSHVKRVGPYADVIGGNMWSNRDNWLNSTGAPTNAFVDGCTAYAEEDGKDVVYAYVKTTKLFRYRINDLQSPALDRWETVGRYWGGPGSKTACAYDPVGKSFLRVATNATPFVYWDLNKAGASNNDVKMTPSDPSGEFANLRSSNAIDMRNCGLDFDPTRRQYALWCGGGSVWMLEPPASLSAAGWTIRKSPVPAGAVPDGAVGVGVLGKWKYARDLDAFVALQDAVAGNIWIYKPVGWQNPGGGEPDKPNVAPQVAITSPAEGSELILGTPVAVNASATDSDGSVDEVEFFANGTSIGTDATAPYSLTWANAPSGAHSLVARATDDRGAQTSSNPVTITVRPKTGGGDGGEASTVVLQRGLDDYALSSETYLSTYHKALSFGSSTLLQDQASNYSSLIRFGIFQSEGGPVPDGATIEAATLSLYKYSAYDMTYAVHRMLKPWREGSANWTQTGLSGSWTIPGANGAGSDYASSPDATASVSFASGQWVDFDVTAAVQQFSQGVAMGNQGWRLKAVRGYTSAVKRFYTSDYATDTRFRPKLTVSYRR